MEEDSMLSPYFLLEQSSNYFVFDGGDGVIHKINKIVYDILQLCKTYNITYDNDLNEISDLLSEQYSQEEIIMTIHEIKNSYREGFLNTRNKLYNLYEDNYLEDSKGQCLWLNVSHDCNLRCIYCFGNGGDYGKSRILMSQETAKKCIDIWFSTIKKEKKLYEVNFFGGEPLMNQKVIFYCVSYINELIKQTDMIVRYNLTTNGTILNDSVIQMFQENDFKVSISIDGIEKIHNDNRPYVSGKGSFSDIVANIEKLKNSIPRISCQITLTRENIHLLKMAVTKLWELGVNFVYSNLVFDSNEIYNYEDYHNYHQQVCELSQMTFDNIQNKIPHTYHNLFNIMYSIHSKAFSTNCFYWTGGAMIFSPEGEAYSCYRFVGDHKYQVGDVNRNNIHITKQVKPYNSKCSNCWAQLHCGDGCVYENSIYSNDIYHPAEEWCAKTKISLEEGLKLYTKLLIESPNVFDQIFRRKEDVPC